MLGCMFIHVGCCVITTEKKTCSAIVSVYVIVLPGLLKASYGAQAISSYNGRVTREGLNNAILRTTPNKISEPPL